MVSEKDLAWMAGLMDGEGCISLYHRNRYGGGWDYFVQIANTNPDIIKRSVEIALAVTGEMPYVRLDRNEKGNRRENRRPGFCVVLSKKSSIVSFLSALVPYLVGKRAEAETLLFAIHHKAARSKAVETLRVLKQNAPPSYADAEVMLEGLRFPAHRNDYRVSPNNNPGTSARPAPTQDDIVWPAEKSAEVPDKEPGR